jgi:hypothetical protein
VWAATDLRRVATGGTDPLSPEVGMRALLVALGALAVLLVGTVPALADPPARVHVQITDTVGALGADGPRVQSALDRLQRVEGTRVSVVLASGLDAVNGSDWATATASLSGLAASDMLFAVNVTDGTYQWWIGDSFPLPDTDVSNVMAARVEPLLATGAWADAVIGLADGLTPGTSTFLGGPPQARPWSTTTTALVGGIVVVTLGGAHVLSRRRKTAATPR